LPSSAAQALRQIAAWMERDRRLLSARHWHGVGRPPEPLERVHEVEDAGGSRDDSADQA
jgi:hypothetical protein